MTKYNAKKTIINGITFDSKLEAEYYTYLKKQKEEGLIKDFSLQPAFILQPSFEKYGKKHREIKYIADFKVFLLDGSTEIIDIKGMETTDWKIKRKLFDYVFPELTLKPLKKVVKFGGWITIDDYKTKKREEKKNEKY